MTKPIALSLFAGAGGLDFGINAAGCKTVCAIERDPHCAATLRRNARGKAVWQVDIRAVDPNLAADALGFRPGGLALLHGGPPCQPFSQIGKKGGLDDPRGKLIFEMVRFTEALRPNAVLIEQVPKFLDAPVGDGLLQDALAEEFLALGYDMHAGVFNAADFSVPQNRKRAILVCVGRGQDYSFPVPVFTTPVTVGEALRESGAHQGRFRLAKCPHAVRGRRSTGLGRLTRGKHSSSLGADGVTNRCQIADR